MKILVTGVNGQLGYDVVRELQKREIECLGVDKDDFDITDRSSTVGFIENYSPDAVIHCAAYTAVDKAEDDSENCRKVNSTGSGNVAFACEKIGAKIIYISTDYVFGGDGEKYYETSDKKAPQNVYGRTKLDGEKQITENCKKHFIVRTSWVFGINGGNFVKTMRRIAAEKDVIGVVSDQIGSPTYTFDLAKLLCDMAVSEKYGIYHATNENVCSWADFCREILRLSGLKAEVKDLTTEEYPVKAKRPKNSRLSKSSLDDAGFERLPTWQDALERYIKELEQI